ncbi:MAG TPA: oligosaccharide flippase family protein [bacterium]|nr:oligosaccharide flippase family protein [bacterium]HQI47587.1 oligosaccharide flippase family protein [bacterium]HQJ64365.1 oligosaccharide flippase family protein [bacterium]HQJ65477.1 oligosaccharide flippase family protein [bacterium]
MSLYQPIKRLVKHSAVYGLGHVLSRSVGFLLLPLYTNIFSTDGFGVAGLAMTWLTILTLLYSYGLDAGFMRFYILASQERERRAIFTTATLALSCTSLIFSLLLGLLAPHLVTLFFGAGARGTGIDLVLLIRLLAGILFCDTAAFIPLLLLRAEEKSWLYVLIKVGSALVLLAANLYCILAAGMGVEGIFIANLVSSALTLAAALGVLLHSGAGRLSRDWLKQLLRFGLPFLPTGLAIALLDSADRLMLERLDSVAAAGLYNAGAKVGMIMGLLVAAFRFAWQPYFLATSRENEAKKIFSRILTWMLAACLALFLLMSLFVDELLRLRIDGYTFFGSAFWESSRVVPLIMLASLFYALYLIFEAALYLEKKSGLIALVTLAGVAVNLAVNFWLIPLYGPLGSAWARAIAYAGMALGLYGFAQRYYPIPYEWLRILRLVLCSAAVFGLAMLPALRSSTVLRAFLLASWPLLLWGSGFFRSSAGEKSGFLSQKLRKLVADRRAG